MERITKAIEGQIVEIKDVEGVDKMTVKPSCKGKPGQWFCITCNETFVNQFMKDSHITTGEHQLAWICPTHGLEVP